MSAESITIRRPDDFHVHLRDEAMLRTVLPYTTRQFARALVMPNLVPPVTDIKSAQLYRYRILAALPQQSPFEPLMSCYLTEAADPEEIETGYHAGLFKAAKLYPSHATTNAQFGVSDISKIYAVLERMEKISMPLLIHGEDTSPDADIFDRERIFIERTLAPLLERFSDLKIVLEHITTKFAVDFINVMPGSRLAATITPHHLLINRNAMFAGGLRPHAYCLPVAKREQDRLALRKAATGGTSRFFLGTDSAPHLSRTKESACGCAGIFCAPVAMETYTQVFAEENALHNLEAFASEYGARFYGLPLNEGDITLKRSIRRGCSRISASHDFVESFRGGEELHWTFDESIS